MRIATWLLNQRVLALQSQVDYLVGFKPDVICFQEITRSTDSILCEALMKQGYCSYLSTVSEVQSGPRRYGVSIASNQPLILEKARSNPIWPERLIVAKGDFGTVINTHIPPGSSNGFVKVEMLEAAFDEFIRADGPSLLAGDFNAPQLEFPQLVTWAQRKTKDENWRITRFAGERWDLAERRFFDGSVIDAFRFLHPDVQATSWSLTRKLQSFMRRFDHIFVTPHWRPTYAEYMAINRGLSDHALLIVDVVIEEGKHQRISC